MNCSKRFKKNSDIVRKRKKHIKNCHHGVVRFYVLSEEFLPFLTKYLFLRNGQPRWANGEHKFTYHSFFLRSVFTKLLSEHLRTSEREGSQQTLHVRNGYRDVIGPGRIAALIGWAGRPIVSVQSNGWYRASTGCTCKMVWLWTARGYQDLLYIFFFLARV